MNFKIEWLEVKKEDWKVATLRDETGQMVEEVSLNRTDKDGSLAFTNFDDLSVGSEIQGNLWKHPTKGTYTLYPQRQGETRTPATYSRGGAAGMMATKKANIEQAQETKSHAIKVAAAMRDATLIAIALMGDSPEDKDGFIKSFTTIKEWYLTEWDKTDKSLNVPF